MYRFLDDEPSSFMLLAALIFFGIALGAGCSDSSDQSSPDAGIDSRSDVDTDIGAEAGDAWDIPDPFADVDREPVDEELPERRRFLGVVESTGRHAYALAISLEDRVDYRLLVYDIGGNAPELVGKALTANQPSDIVVADGLAYLATNAIGTDEPSLVIYDVTNPESPRWYGSTSLSGSGPSGEDCFDRQTSAELHFRVLGERAYVGCSYGIATIDVSRPEAPKILDTAPTSAHVLRLAAFSRTLSDDVQHLVLPLMNGESEVPIYLLDESGTREMGTQILLNMNLSAGSRVDAHIPDTLGETQFSQVDVAVSGRGGALALSQVIAYADDDQYTPDTYTATDLTFGGLLGAVAVVEHQVYVAVGSTNPEDAPTVQRVAFAPLRDPKIEASVEMAEFQTIYDLSLSGDRVIAAGEARQGDGIAVIPTEAIR